MKVPHWCMLGVTIWLLMCEVAISRLCKSLITLVDGSHTLIILMRLALSLPQTISTIKSPLSSMDSSGLPPSISCSLATPPPASPAGIYTKPLSGTQTTTGRSNHEEAPQSKYEASCSSGALHCGLSYTNSRVQVVGVFVSALFLFSLCISYLLEIVSYFLEPHPVLHPLLLVVVGVVSLLHKLLLFKLNRDQQRRSKADPQVDSHLQVNHKVLAEEVSTGPEEFKNIIQSKVQHAAEPSLHGKSLVLCNPATSRVSDTDSQTTQIISEVPLCICEALSYAECCEHHSRNITKCPECDTCLEHLDSQNTSKLSPVCKSSSHPERHIGLLSTVVVIQGLLTSLLALINSLVMWLIPREFLHSSGACSFLMYLDPCLSLLAVITLIITTAPQVHRYGLLLLQATPPHIGVSDVGWRIVSVTEVQAVHDLHIWELTESLVVASVHVHCYAGFPAQRYADLMSGVTKVLQGVGVSCCTVQPEFTPCPESSEGECLPVVHREDPSQPPRLGCSLSCGKACAGNMCCSLTEVGTPSLPSPAAVETREEPQTLVIENTFL
ncbi:uncharacterized protein KZ484_022945 [Pholidichthys leucotaenia]